MVVSNELKEPIRSHHDIDRDSAKHFKRATKVEFFVLFHRPLIESRYSSTKHSPNARRTMAIASISSRDVSIKSVSSR